VTTVEEPVVDAGTARAVDVVMPRLSDSIEEGVFAQWLKQVGDPL
jgi:hypothetical protein